MFVYDNKFKNITLISELIKAYRTYYSLVKINETQSIMFDNLVDSNTKEHLITSVVVGNNKVSAIREYLTELTKEILLIPTSGYMGYSDDTKIDKYSVKVQDLLIGVISNTDIHNEYQLFTFFTVYLFGYDFKFIDGVLNKDLNMVTEYVLDKFGVLKEYQDNNAFSKYLGVYDFTKYLNSEPVTKTIDDEDIVITPMDKLLDLTYSYIEMDKKGSKGFLDILDSVMSEATEGKN